MTKQILDEMKPCSNRARICALVCSSAITGTSVDLVTRRTEAQAMIKPIFEQVIKRDGKTLTIRLSLNNAGPLLERYASEKKGWRGAPQEFVQVSPITSAQSLARFIESDPYCRELAGAYLTVARLLRY